MPKLFSIDIKLCATAYVVADTEEEALTEIDATFGEFETADLPTGDCGPFEIDGGAYSADMPEISLSPAVTFYGPWDGQRSMELVEDFDSDEEA